MPYAAIIALVADLLGAVRKGRMDEVARVAQELVTLARATDEKQNALDVSLDASDARDAARGG